MRVCELDSAFTFTLSSTERCGSASCRLGWELLDESSLFSSHGPPSFRRVCVARLESFDHLQKYLLILGLILVILCNFVPKSMRMPLRYAVSH